MPRSLNIAWNSESSSRFGIFTFRFCFTDRFLLNLSTLAVKVLWTQMTTDFFSSLVQIVSKSVRKLQRIPSMWYVRYFIPQHGTRASLVPGGFRYTTVGFSLLSPLLPFLKKDLAFHSALVLLGTLRICKTGGTAVQTFSCELDKLTIYPNRAVQTLYKLDSGNRIVDRCRYYLERFIILSDTTGMVIFNAT